MRAKPGEIRIGGIHYGSHHLRHSVHIRATIEAPPAPMRVMKHPIAEEISARGCRRLVRVSPEVTPARMLRVPVRHALTAKGHPGIDLLAIARVTRALIDRLHGGNLFGTEALVSLRMRRTFQR